MATLVRVFSAKRKHCLVFASLSNLHGSVKQHAPFQCFWRNRFVAQNTIEKLIRCLAEIVGYSVGGNDGDGIKRVRVALCFVRARESGDFGKPHLKPHSQGVSDHDGARSIERNDRIIVSVRWI